MTKEEFVKKIEAIGFVRQEQLISGCDFYKKQIGDYKVQADVGGVSVLIRLFYKDIKIATFEWLSLNDATISILKNFLKVFGDKNDYENYTITFDVKDMIKEAEFCGYKINEEQAKQLIDYLDRKADGVYETIQQYITGYCQNNKFEELKEE